MLWRLIQLDPAWRRIPFLSFLIVLAVLCARAALSFEPKADEASMGFVLTNMLGGPGMLFVLFFFVFSATPNQRAMLCHLSLPITARQSLAARLISSLLLTWVPIAVSCVLVAAVSGSAATPHVIRLLLSGMVITAATIESMAERLPDYRSALRT